MIRSTMKEKRTEQFGYNMRGKYFQDIFIKVVVLTQRDDLIVQIQPNCAKSG